MGITLPFRPFRPAAAVWTAGCILLFLQSIFLYFAPFNVFILYYICSSASVKIIPAEIWRFCCLCNAKKSPVFHGEKRGSYGNPAAFCLCCLHFLFAFAQNVKIQLLQYARKYTYVVPSLLLVKDGFLHTRRRSR